MAFLVKQSIISFYNINIACTMRNKLVATFAVIKLNNGCWNHHLTLRFCGINPRLIRILSNYLQFLRINITPVKILILRYITHFICLWYAFQTCTSPHQLLCNRIHSHLVIFRGKQMTISVHCNLKAAITGKYLNCLWCQSCLNPSGNRVMT